MLICFCPTDKCSIITIIFNNNKKLCSQTEEHKQERLLPKSIYFLLYSGKRRKATIKQWPSYFNAFLLKVGAKTLLIF